jgi:hypothetical protein
MKFISLTRVCGSGVSIVGWALIALLLLCDSDDFAERDLNLSFVSTKTREKHAAEPVQFRIPIARFKSFGQCFRFPC